MGELSYFFSHLQNLFLEQVLQSLDQLRRAPKSNMSELEATDCISALHTLYTMTLTPIGQLLIHGHMTRYV